MIIDIMVHMLRAESAAKDRDTLTEALRSVRLFGVTEKSINIICSNPVDRRVLFLARQRPDLANAILSWESETEKKQYTPRIEDQAKLLARAILVSNLEEMRNLDPKHEIAKLEYRIFSRHANPDALPPIQGFVEETASVKPSVFIDPKAIVYEKAKIVDFVKVYRSSEVYGEAILLDFAKLKGPNKIGGTAIVGDHTTLEGGITLMAGKLRENMVFRTQTQVDRWMNWKRQFIQEEEILPSVDFRKLVR